MASTRVWIFIPLPLREMILRLLLICAFTNILTNIPALVLAHSLENIERHFGSITIVGRFGTTPVFFAFAQIVLPLLIILHHILRLWRRRWWLVIWEALFSLVEVVVVGVFLLPSFTETWMGNNITAGIDTSIALLQGASLLSMSASSFLAFFFLLCDILNSHCRSFLREYDFSAGLSRPGRGWSFVFGRFTAKKRFSTDGTFIRYIRGGIAIICLLVISSLVFYSFILQPLQWSGSPQIKVFRIPISDGQLSYALESVMKDYSGGVLEEGRPLRAMLTIPNVTVPDQLPAMSMSIATFNPLLAHPFPARGCTNGTHARAVFAPCPDVSLPQSYDVVIELLLTINFSRLPAGAGDPRVYLGMTDSVDDILASAEPVNIAAGSNLRGISSISVRERFSGRSAAALGISQYYRFAVINVRDVIPDLSPLLEKDNRTATLRIIIQSQPDIQVEQDYIEGSVLNGFAVVGGVWTLVNGVFAAIFGSTLLLVLFGIKPLSIYGLVHRFQKRASLTEGDYVLSPEERDRIVMILKEHLLDVDSTEGDETLPSQYTRIGILPRFNRPHCDIGTQT